MDNIASFPGSSSAFVAYCMQQKAGEELGNEARIIHTNDSVYYP